MKNNGNTFFLLRHGQTDFNARNLIAGAVEERKENPPHLNGVGEEQVKRAAESLVSESLDVIYSSPFRRTMQTAKIVSKRIGVDVKIDNRLREVDVGAFVGRTLADWEKYFEGKDALVEGPPGGESLNDVLARVKEFLDDINHKYRNKNILIVGHGDPLWMMQSIFLGVEGQNILKTPYIENGKIKKLEA